MKKLVLLASIAIATVSQAASVTWSSGVAIKGYGGNSLPAGDIKMYVFEFASEAAYNAADIASLDVASAALSGATTKSSTGITLVDTTTYGAGDTVYSAVILTATEGGKEYYRGEKLTPMTIDDLGSDVSFTSLKNKGTWTERSGGGGTGGVPEPTSGLLLALGGAMLALRRRRA